MQLAGKMAASDLNDVQNDAAAHTNWLAPKLRTVSTVAARAIGVLVALGSMAAVAIEGALSMAGYGLALLLGKIRPLRDAYQFLSRGYDRFIERLGQKVLRDTRDAPALRLMVSLTLTTVPIFIIQLIRANRGCF